MSRICRERKTKWKETDRKGIKWIRKKNEWERERGKTVLTLYFQFPYFLKSFLFKCLFLGVNKTPVKSRILPKSPTKSPAKPPIARKPGFPPPPKPSQKAGMDKGSESPKPLQKGSDLKREEESRDETDSKKIKLSQVCTIYILILKSIMIQTLRE